MLCELWTPDEDEGDAPSAVNPTALKSQVRMPSIWPNGNAAHELNCLIHRWIWLSDPEVRPAIYGLQSTGFAGISALFARRIARRCQQSGRQNQTAGHGHRR